MSQLALDFNRGGEPLPEWGPGWDDPIKPEGDPRQTVKDIVRVIEGSYQYFGGWGDSLERVLDVTLHALKGEEEEYVQAAKKMDKRALEAACQVFALLLEGFCIRYNIWDYLGEVYMELGSRSKHQAFGQFFTPMNVTEMMAAMQLGDVRESIEGARKEGRRISVMDPTCGSGAMLLGAKRRIVGEVGLDGLRWFEFYGIDIDPVCVKMCQVQMIMTDFRYMTDWLIVKGFEVSQRARA